MPVYLHPGVYIEEQPAPQTIEGVSTSTAGFVGATQKGPTEGLPQLITSFPDFLRVYGSYLPEEPWKNTRYLAYAVEGFFNNGGQRVYIKRVVDSENAQKARLTLNDGFVTRLSENTASLQAARNVVKLASLRGISVSSRLRFTERIAGQNESQVRTVTAYNARQGSVTLNEPLTWQYTVAGCQVTLEGVASPDTGDPSLDVMASSEGKWGESLEVTINDTDGTIGIAAAAPVKTTLRVLQLAFSAGGPNQGNETTLTEVSQLQSGDMVEFSTGGATAQTERRTLSEINGSTIRWVDDLENDYRGAGSTIHRVTALRTGARNPTVLVESVAGLQAEDLVRLTQGETTQLAQIATGGVDTPNRQITLDTSTHTIASSYLAGDEFALATAGRGSSDQLNLSSTNNFYERAVIEVDDGTRKDYYTVTQIVGNSLTVSPALTSAVASGTVVRVVEFTLSVSDGTTTEAFSNLSLDPTAPNFAETVVNLRSRLIRVTNRGSTRTRPFNIPRTTNGAAVNLTSGNDGNPPTADDYRGTDEGPGKRTGIKALADIDNISIIAAPGIGDPSVHAELINQCEQMKDRFAVLDPFSDSVIGSGNDSTDIEMQRGKHDTFYAAMYYPWLRIRDPDGPNGRLVPPSGHVIGIYARVDTERGVQKAPANEVIRGIAGVEIKLSDREQDVLNPKNINAIRDFRDNNRGIRVWGSRCLTSDNAWKYVPVRRLFIFLEESLDEGLQWVVFEPNGEALWARVRRTISGFLRTLWLSGALAGVTEEEAFFVKCDRTTMTEDDIANGRLIILVGAAPLRPAEFVIVRVSQKTLEASS